MDSKINRQIRKLGKQVDGILDARAKGKHQKGDWIIGPFLEMGQMRWTK